MKTGCRTCRQRRIKCDEGRPICANCVKSQRECEGYRQRAIFKAPIGNRSPHPSLITTIPDYEMGPSEQTRKLQLPTGQYSYDDCIERWQKQASPTAEAPEGTIQHLYISCLNALSLLIERHETGKHDSNSLRRCHGMLELWADQYGVHNGTMEATLQRSVDIRQAILELLLPLCKTLLQGERLLTM